MTLLSTDHFDRHIDQYLDERHKLFNHQFSGVQANRRDLNLFSTFLHEKRHTHVTGDVLLSFIAMLRTERQNCAGSINRKIASIRSYIKYLRFRQVAGAGDLPVEYLSRAREPYPGPIAALTVEEVERILACVDTQSTLGYRDYLLYSLLYRLGLRLGEALGINLEDIDLHNAVLTINGKGRRKRILPLVSDVEKTLRCWIDIRGRLLNADSHAALFLSKKGGRLSARTAQENLQKLLQPIGPFSIDKVTPHSFRHAFATHAVEGNADLVVLKAVMGHASIHTTQIYLHPSLKVMRKAVNDHIASEILSGLIEHGVIILRTQQRYNKAA